MVGLQYLYFLIPEIYTDMIAYIIVKPFLAGLRYPPFLIAFRIGSRCVGGIKKVVVLLNSNEWLGLNFKFIYMKKRF